MGIKFNSMEVSATSRATTGVKGMSLKADDTIAAVYLLETLLIN